MLSCYATKNLSWTALTSSPSPWGFFSSSSSPFTVYKIVYALISKTLGTMLCLSLDNTFLLMLSLSKPSVFFSEVQETPPAHHLHLRYQSRRNPAHNVVFWSYLKSTLKKNWASWLTPQYFSLLKICGGRAWRCPSFFLALARIKSRCSSIPGAEISTTSTNIPRLFRIIRIRCWLFVI